MIFEWDKTKAAENDAKHGVTFELAKSAFEDAFALARVDDRHNYGEERVILTGMAEGLLLVIVFTEREDRIRLISARRANKREYGIYVRQNS